ncbi:N-6 DNA methylase [Paenirhodobacter populi]|uniref:N-6 DNA methylase n=1 Tax=Paenirhodobacter populi TaxID=2306993 RepID=UPI00240E99FE|nr:N-6 DNA methylase [Sinirhodobacter populi]
MFVVLLMMLHPTQELEPPANPERFKANILYLVLKEFLKVDLHPDHGAGNDKMGLIFENLIRRFNELANETAGDHFTPREVTHLMVDLLFMNADDCSASQAR